MQKIRAGIVGLGRLGLRHAEDLAFRIAGVELVGACSINPAEFEQIKTWGIPNLSTDFETFVKTPDMDAIIICSSSGLHAEQICRALEEGKHVFSEKPLGITIDQCLEVEKAVARHPELIFFLGFMRRFDASYQAAWQKVQSGAIGKPMLMRCTSIDPERCIDGFLRFAPTSGGTFLDLAVHDIDLAHWFLGSDVDTIYAVGGAYKHPEVAEFGGDTAFSLMKFKNGTCAFLHAGRTAPHGYHIEAEIVGTEGTLRIGSVPRKNQLEIFNQDGVLVECPEGFLERFSDAYLKEKVEFFDCIRTGRKPEIKVQDGTRATRIAFQATEAYRTGELVHV